MAIFDKSGRPMLVTMADLVALVGQTQGEQAREIGISPERFSQIIHGHKPKRSTAKSMARFYNRAERVRRAGIRLDHIDVLALVAESKGKAG